MAVSNNQSEASLARRLIQWLKQNRWDVYQEVQPYTYGNCADVVAVKPGLVWVIETKTSLSLDAMAQAHEWLTSANMVAIAIPYGRKQRSKSRHFAKMVLRQYGIGLIEVHMQWTYTTVAVEPKQDPNVPGAVQLRQSLCKEHQTFAQAGNAVGKRFTKFQQTVQRLTAHVVANPGVLLKDAVAAIDHHYANRASAKNSLRERLKDGTIKTIRLEHPSMRLYPPDREISPNRAFHRLHCDT